MKHIEHIEHVEQVEPWTDWTSDPLTLTHHIGESKTMAMAPSPSPSNTSPWEDRRVLWHLWDREIHWWIMTFPEFLLGVFLLKCIWPVFRHTRLIPLVGTVWSALTPSDSNHSHISTFGPNGSKGQREKEWSCSQSVISQRICAWKTELAQPEQDLLQNLQSRNISVSHLWLLCVHQLLSNYPVQKQNFNTRHRESAFWDANF